MYKGIKVVLAAVDVPGPVMDQVARLDKSIVDAGLGSDDPPVLMRLFDEDGLKADDVEN